jgi:hypothetical protein
MAQYSHNAPPPPILTEVLCMQELELASTDHPDSLAFTKNYNPLVYEVADEMRTVSEEPKRQI